ncbi:hypothetical protein F441_15149 [Phytophthora nicotianae CJ01A1]|uniref:Uncharacterized protein n=1 Tax=Phytophthora nicotianae CJ01A1 TaxID=1317063 RepID=W2WEA3_PHYNI|nr:hypothetical protein F441_15149 [Phytophthora nicotianae CJ01A1]
MRYNSYTDDQRQRVLSTALSSAITLLFMPG